MLSCWNNILHGGTRLTPPSNSSCSIFYYRPIFDLTLPLSPRHSKSCYTTTLIFRNIAIIFLLLPPRARAYSSEYPPSVRDSLSFHSSHAVTLCFSVQSSASTPSRSSTSVSTSTSSPFSHHMVLHFQLAPIRDMTHVTIS